MKKRVLALTLLILGTTAGAAVAMTLNGDGTLVGTNQNDSINAKHGNDTIWGEAGSDTINAGNGNDMIDGDGQCPGDDQGKVFPHGIQDSNQCEHGDQDQNGQKDTINAGNGNDTIFGGGGHNTINTGAGMDTVYGGPLGDTINVNAGNSNDSINLCGTPNTGEACSTSYTHSTVNLLSTKVNGTVNAQNGYPDTINCFGSPATVFADNGLDTTNGCPHVVRSAAIRAARWSTATKAKRARAHKAARHRAHRTR